MYLTSVISLWNITICVHITGPVINPTHSFMHTPDDLFSIFHFIEVYDNVLLNTNTIFDRITIIFVVMIVGNVTIGEAYFLSSTSTQEYEKVICMYNRSS